MLPAPLAASVQTYPQDVVLTVAGVGIKIMGGSQADILTPAADSFTVTVAADEAFIIRYPGGNPGSLENDGGLAVCNVLRDRDNQMLVYGPKTVTVRPMPVPCSTANYDTNNTPALVVLQPNGGETLTAGQKCQLFWQTSGTGAGSVRLRLSTDGGASYQTAITSGLINNGFYEWTVPAVVTTNRARIKIEGFNQGRIDSLDVSDAAFTIIGTEPPPEQRTVPPPTPSYDFDPAAATAAAGSVDDDLGLAEAQLPKGALTCAAGSRIKGASNPAVYYCGRDGKRHAFPNQKIHDSWFQGFEGVVTVPDATLAQVPLGANMKYRPGVRLVKIQTDPKVYAVAAHGTLRWIPDEWTAAAVYGSDWNRKIDDLSDAFFADYKIGEPVRQL